MTTTTTTSTSTTSSTRCRLPKPVFTSKSISPGTFDHLFFRSFLDVHSASFHKAERFFCSADGSSMDFEKIKRKCLFPGLDLHHVEERLKFKLKKKKSKKAHKKRLEIKKKNPEQEKRLTLKQLRVNHSIRDSKKIDMMFLKQQRKEEEEEEKDHHHENDHQKEFSEE